MPVMTCEELNSVWSVKRRLEREKRNLIDLQIMAEPASPRLDGMPHTHPLTYKVEGIATMMVDSQRLIDQLGESLAQRKFALLNKLQSLNLNELQQRVLSYHYVACLKFKEIARLMSFTDDYIHFLHRHGLKSLGLSVDIVKKFRKSSENSVSA